MTKIYYKFESDCADHDGTWHDGYYICEVIDGITQRQIIEINDDLYWATLHDEKDELFFFTDQPEFSEEDVSDARENFGLVELTSAQFEELWLRSGATENA